MVAFLWRRVSDSNHAVKVSVAVARIKVPGVCWLRADNVPREVARRKWVRGHVKFLYLVCRDETIKATPGEIPRAVEPWLRDVQSRGVLLQGQPLESPSEAVTIRVREGEVIVHNGPFAETVERIVGFDIVECKSMKEAVVEARRHPMAPFGSIEVRAFDNS